MENKKKAIKITNPFFAFYLGFIPTFGPAFIHLYGSTRDYSLIDEHSNLNAGLGEGVSYRGRLLIALKTDISDSIDTAPSEVEVEPTQTIHEVIIIYNKFCASKYRVLDRFQNYLTPLIRTLCS